VKGGWHDSGQKHFSMLSGRSVNVSSGKRSHQ
jgi:hypothetical protein